MKWQIEWEKRHWKDDMFQFEVKVFYEGKYILTTPYFMGKGHAQFTGEDGAKLKREFIRSRLSPAVFAKTARERGFRFNMQEPEPDAEDVVGCVLTDAQCGMEFEDVWEYCEEFGVQPTRKMNDAFQMMRKAAVAFCRAGTDVIKEREELEEEQYA